ncbi:uncharacterized protein ACRADG_008294 isoform 2-T2 [Cochliomyia hominivorax]
MSSSGIAADPLKVVNILLPPNTANNDNNNNKDNNSEGSSEDNERNNSASNNSGTGAGGYVPPRSELKDDVLYTEPTFSEKFFRYLVIVIYLGGLSSLGFFLSIYYIFFWDSHMPPVYKPTKKPPVFIKP